MEIDKPNDSGFTIYSKSGCPNCLKSKSLLKEKNLLFNIIDCDEYIIEDKPFFLSFINNLANEEVKTFPMIFYNGKFTGGFIELKNFVDKLLLSFEDNFSF
jgi:glutaredoxin